MADCKRKTANLFDKDATYNAGVYNNVYTISGLDTSKQYTCSTSLERIAGAQAACIYFSQTTSISSATNGVWKNEEKTFSPNENGELFVHVRNTAASGAPAIANDVMSGAITIMLNTGETALPYEPYWQHFLRKYDGLNWIDVTVKEWDGSQWQ